MAAGVPKVPLQLSKRRSDKSRLYQPSGNPGQSSRQSSAKTTSSVFGGRLVTPKSENRYLVDLNLRYGKENTNSGLSRFTNRQNMTDESLLASVALDGLGDQRNKQAADLIEEGLFDVGSGERLAAENAVQVEELLDYLKLAKSMDFDKMEDLSRDALSLPQIMSLKKLSPKAKQKKREVEVEPKSPVEQSYLALYSNDEKEVEVPPLPKPDDTIVKRNMEIATRWQSHKLEKQEKLSKHKRRQQEVYLRSLDNQTKFIELTSQKLEHKFNVSQKVMLANTSAEYRERVIFWGRIVSLVSWTSTTYRLAVEERKRRLYTRSRLAATQILARSVLPAFRRAKRKKVLMAFQEGSGPRKFVIAFLRQKKEAYRRRQANLIIDFLICNKVRTCFTKMAHYFHGRVVMLQRFIRKKQQQVKSQLKFLSLQFQNVEKNLIESREAGILNDIKVLVAAKVSAMHALDYEPDPLVARELISNIISKTLERLKSKGVRELAEKELRGKRKGDSSGASVIEYLAIKGINTIERFTLKRILCRAEVYREAFATAPHVRERLLKEVLNHQSYDRRRKKAEKAEAELLESGGKVHAKEEKGRDTLQTFMTSVDDHPLPQVGKKKKQVFGFWLPKSHLLSLVHKGLQSCNRHLADNDDLF